MVRIERAGLGALVAALGGPGNVRIIGGAVRDTLLALPVSDIDLATRLEPGDVMARLQSAGIKAVPTGLAHGTVTAVTEGGPVEVTTLRRDVETDGRRATVAFTDDWQDDAARRDFTINALAADPATGEVFDYFGGLADLDAGRVRFIGDPLQRIAEDHLRILRFFRFHARFGKGEPDAAALAACAARANDLMALSRERIASELLKLLDANSPENSVDLMLEHAVLAPVLPEIAHANALKRVISRENEFGIAGNNIRRLAALIGPDPALARDIAHRLKLSNAQAKRLVSACTPYENMATQALAYRRGLDEAIDALLLADGDPRPLMGWQKPTFPITGGTLIERGLKPGPIVAKTLQAIENKWIDSGFPTGPEFERLVNQAL